MATITTTSPIVAALPAILTVEDVAINVPTRDVQVILVPTEVDRDLFEEGVAAWNICLVEGQTTRFIGNVTEVRLEGWFTEFVGQYVDHEQDDLFVSDVLRTRDGAARSATRWYFSQVELYARQYAAQERREALAAAPGQCQIDGCYRDEDSAHVIIKERVYSACGSCRHYYDLEVASAV